MISDISLNTLKAVDPDRLRASVFADKTGRERLAVLYAFHHELAKVPEIVSEPMLGDIRYQWWRDVLEEIYAGKHVRKHEVTTPLAEMFKSLEMPRFWADRLIDARARDLDPTPFTDLDAARDYCRQTSGILMQMAARCLSAEVDDDAVLKAGEAWGLTGLTRAWRYYHKSMLSQIDYNALCDAASETHEAASFGLKNMPADAFPAVAYAALIPKYLARLTKSGHNPAEDTVDYSPLMKRFHLLWAAMRGRI